MLHLLYENGEVVDDHDRMRAKVLYLQPRGEGESEADWLGKNGLVPSEHVPPGVDLYEVEGDEPRWVVIFRQTDGDPWVMQIRGAADYLRFRGSRLYQTLLLERIFSDLPGI